MSEASVWLHRAVCAGYGFDPTAADGERQATGRWKGAGNGLGGRSPDTARPRHRIGAGAER
ncbi:hypothetical protein ABXI96_18150, partial [Gordonia polyisoprenivorans]